MTHDTHVTSADIYAAIQELEAYAFRSVGRKVTERVAEELASRMAHLTALIGATELQPDQQVRLAALDGLVPDTLRTRSDADLNARARQFAVSARAIVAPF